MKILFLLDNIERVADVRKFLAQVSELDSIVFYDNYYSAEEFIQRSVIGEQKPVDLIIVQDGIGGKKATDFFERIMSDRLRTFSNRDFIFCTIPVVLLMNSDENQSAFVRYGFADALQLNDFEKLPLFIKYFTSSVKKWRKQVVDELSNLGVDFRTGGIDYSFLLQKKKEITSTRIVSENFQLFPRILRYEWLEINQRQIELAIDKFSTLLKRAMKSPKDNEKAFHALFNEHPSLLLRDNYSDHKYEPRLEKGDGTYDKPDYALTPNFSQRTDLSIVEVKLPDELFIKRTKFHASPYSKLMNHIFQINDYKEYLESDEHLSAIEKLFGFIPKKIEYSLLVGRLEEKLKQEDILQKRMRQMGARKITLMTYDELLEYQVKYLKRVELLNIL